MNMNFILAALLFLLFILCLYLLFQWVKQKGTLALSAQQTTQAEKDQSSLREMLHALEQTQKEIEGERLTLTGHNAALQAQVTEVKEALRKAEQQHKEVAATLELTLKEKGQLATRLAQIDTQRKQEQIGFNEKLAEFKDMKTKLSQEFENLANRIFEEKGKKLSAQHQNELTGLFTPLKQQLADFKVKVEQTYDNESRDRVALKTEILQLRKLNQQLSDDANNLTQALKGQSKTQGDWGEVILESILEHSGLTKGREYEVQPSYVNATLKLSRPDVVIHLPEERDLVIDSKVSLTAYEIYHNATDQVEKEKAIKEHLHSVRTHIKGLSGKNYQDLEGIHTLDFVLMFIPLEAAFLLAHDQDPSLFKEAYDSNILLTSPSTLLITLRTISNLWRSADQNKNAKEIARQASGMLDKFNGFIDAIDDVGKHIDQAKNSHAKAVGRLYSGQGNLIQKAHSLVQLGVDPKKELPKPRVEL